MYEENLLNQLNAECTKLWWKWHELYSNPETRRSSDEKEARKNWCKSVDILSEALSLEFLTNPRYDNIKEQESRVNRDRYNS